MEIKRVEDYYDKIKEKFPDLEMWEIEKILHHGFQSMFTLNNNGADVMLKSQKGFLMYFGRLFNNKDLWWKYRNIKSRIKFRIKYLAKKPVWDGIYYFGLTEEEYNTLKNKKKGRYKNKITFPKLRIYKIKEEACLLYNIKYLFKLTGEEDQGLSNTLSNFSTRNIELIEIKDKNGKMQTVNG